MAKKKKKASPILDHADDLFLGSEIPPAPDFRELLLHPKLKDEALPTGFDADTGIKRDVIRSMHYERAPRFRRSKPDEAPPPLRCAVQGFAPLRRR